MTQRTDTDLLNWLETNRLVAGFHQFGGDPSRRVNKWIIWDCSGVQCRKLGIGSTLRETLNTAINTKVQQ